MRGVKASLIVAVILFSFAGEALAERFKVGVSMALTGPLAEYGTAVRNGFQMALDEAPDKFANIQFIFDDDRYDPKTALLVMNRMIDVEKVNMMFVWGNEPAFGVAPLAERREIPTFVVAQDPKTAINKKYVVRFINTAAEYSRVLLDYFRSRGWKRIGVLKSEISFFNALLAQLKAQQQEGEVIEEFQNFLPTDSDFRSVVARLKSASFDVVGVYLQPPQVIQFYRQATEQGFHPVTFGSTVFESGTVIKGAFGMMEGAVYSHLDTDGKFRDRYIAKFGGEAEITYAANSYDFAMLVADLFGSLKEPISSAQILDAFSKVPPRDGVTGKFDYHDTADGGKFFKFPVVIKQVKGERVITVQ